MKTIYDGSYDRLELSDDLLARVASDIDDVKKGLKIGRHMSIESYLDAPQEPWFFGGPPDIPVIRVAAGKNYAQPKDDPFTVHAMLGYYVPDGVNGSDWFNTVGVDVRQIPEVYFDDSFVKRIYYSPTGLKYLQLVRKAHLGQLGKAVAAATNAAAEKAHDPWQKGELAYLERVVTAAEKVGKGGDIRLLREAIKTNLERKIWCSRRGGGCC